MELLFNNERVQIIQVRNGKISRLFTPTQKYNVYWSRLNQWYFIVQHKIDVLECIEGDFTVLNADVDLSRFLIKGQQVELDKRIIETPIGGDRWQYFLKEHSLEDEVIWCNVCKDWTVPHRHQSQCGHLIWVNTLNDWGGCGALPELLIKPSIIAEVRECLNYLSSQVEFKDFQRLLESYIDVLKGNYRIENFIYSVVNPAWYSEAIANHSVKAVAGAAWLKSLNYHSEQLNLVTAQWIEEWLNSYR
ncbi:MAG TPA: hypothetical protein VK203_10795 [Nostocaceae cyanobacterium]|nr:hypothetical protein [Nostocaceae cyanobacterium]